MSIALVMSMVWLLPERFPLSENISFGPPLMPLPKIYPLLSCKKKERKNKKESKHLFNSSIRFMHLQNQTSHLYRIYFGHYLYHQHLNQIVICTGKGKKSAGSQNTIISLLPISKVRTKFVGSTYQKAVQARMLKC